MEIKQTSVQMEDINETVGGLGYLNPADIFGKNETYKGVVKSFEKEETDWGNRYNFILELDGYESTFSSWNFISQKKLKPAELVGCNIELKPYTEKKFKLVIL